MNPHQPRRQPRNIARTTISQRALRADARRDHGLFLRGIRAGRRHAARSPDRLSSSASATSSNSPERPPCSRSAPAGAARDPRRPVATAAASRPRRSRASSTTGPGEDRRRGPRRPRHAVLDDYRDLKGRYYKLVSIEMIEAVARASSTLTRAVLATARAARRHAAAGHHHQDQLYEEALEFRGLHPALHLPGQLHPSVTRDHRIAAPSHGPEVFHLEDIGPLRHDLQRWRENFFPGCPSATARLPGRLRAHVGLTTSATAGGFSSVSSATADLLTKRVAAPAPG